MTQKEYNDSVAKWADDVYRFSIHCSSDKEGARDAVQEAYTALWENHRQVDVARCRQYLFSVVYHYWMSHFRHEKVEQAAAPLLRINDVVAPNEHFDLQDALRKALASLPMVQRAAIELKDVEGYSCREIAETLSLSEKQVTVYLFRARVSLKKSLIAMGYDNYNR